MPEDGVDLFRVGDLTVYLAGVSPARLGRLYTVVR